ncbi:MAG: hypothetical protein JWO33_18 [Caulobacteraceae bacterium]|nr:hypothetical protein [Caulobacteraceae bacterium]
MNAHVTPPGLPLIVSNVELVRLQDEIYQARNLAVAIQGLAGQLCPDDAQQNLLEALLRDLIAHTDAATELRAAIQDQQSE